jgi:hypothetical protein
MRRFRGCIWLSALMMVAVPALFAYQAEQTTQNSTAPERKAKTRAKKAKETGEGAASPAGGEAATATAGTGQPPAPETPKTRKAKTTSTGSAQRAVPTVSESEIAAAKASGKVWVNTETGVYHKGGRWYGATRQGKFMTEDEAIKSGYRAAKTK